MTTDVDQLVESLDAAHGKGWHVWRTAMGRWAVQVRSGERVENVTAATLTGAIAAAAAFRFLPTIPRRPAVLGLAQFDAVRTGGKWTLRHNGRHAAGNIGTKAMAMECAARWVARSVADAAEWDERFAALTTTGAEGVDYRWEDHP
jgi:hypothetical protein